MTASPGPRAAARRTDRRRARAAARWQRPGSSPRSCWRRSGRRGRGPAALAFTALGTAGPVHGPRLHHGHGHRPLGKQHPRGVGVRHHQLRLVDWHRPRRDLHQRHLAAVRAALADLDQPLRRGDDALRRHAGGPVPVFHIGPALVRVLAHSVPVRDVHLAAVSLVAAVGRRGGDDLLHACRFSSGTSGLLPDSGPLRDRAPDAARRRLRRLRAGLARSARPLAPIPDRVSRARPGSRPRWSCRSTPS